MEILSVRRVRFWMKQEYLYWSIFHFPFLFVDIHKTQALPRSGRKITYLRFAFNSECCSPRGQYSSAATEQDKRIKVAHAPCRYYRRTHCGTV